MPDSATMTIRLKPELKDRLDKLAEATHRSRSYLAAEAVREYVELNEWQIQELGKAVKEADAEDFATPGEIRSILEKWGIGGN